MEINQIQAIIESVLFAAGDAVKRDYKKDDGRL